METAEIIRYGIIIEGVVIALAVFLLQVIKRMAVDLAVLWEFFGVTMILIGVIPGLSDWIRLISAETGFVLFCMGTVCVLGGIEFSLLLSRLIMQNQEMAVQVSLLNFENERVLAELTEMKKTEALELKREGRNEKDTVCSQYDGAGRGGDGSD